MRTALARASRRGFRLLQFSIQVDHMHLIVEGDDATAFRRGIQGLAIRVAKAVNRVLRRHGHVWADRHHARDLTTPREVRHALVYVLQNWRKHGWHGGGLDGRSSAPWFTGWRVRFAAPVGRTPVVAPATWLARIGWRRHGLVGIDEAPRPRRL
jgi:hypothetical protein